MMRVRDCGRDTVIIVGHSFFFRAIFNTYAKSAVNNPYIKGAQLAEMLRKKVIPNCGVIGVQVAWLSQGGLVFEETVPLFDTDVANSQESPRRNRSRPRPEEDFWDCASCVP